MADDRPEEVAVADDGESGGRGQALGRESGEREQEDPEQGREEKAGAAAPRHPARLDGAPPPSRERSHSQPPGRPASEFKI